MKIHRLVESVETQMEREAIVNCGLYRGIGEPLPERIVKIRIRKDRIPLDSDVSETIMFNVLFERVHGIADIRRRCAFCTPDLTVALGYGSGGATVHVCPLKTASAAYCPSVSDSAAVIRSIRRVFDTDAAENFDQIADLIAEADQSLPSSVILENAIATLPEEGQVTIRNLMQVAQQKVEPYVIVTGEAAIRNIAAAHRGVEVMIFNSDYFYAVRRGNG